MTSSSSNILSLSHAVSTDSPDAPVNPIQTPKKPKESTKKSAPPEFSTYKIPSSLSKSSTPPPPQTAALLNKKLKFEREDEENDRYVKLSTKINDYLEDDLLGGFLSDKGFKKPEANVKLPELEVMYKNIKNSFKKGSKAALVETTFRKALETMEGLACQFTHNPSMQGASQRIIDRMGMPLKMNLRVVAIELDDSFVPGPVATLALSLVGEMATEFSKCNNLTNE